MQITFLGTRGEIESRTKRHKMHTATLFSHLGKHILIDYGENWLGKFSTIKPTPDHILLTHAHPDHAFGLKKPVPCPIWATEQTWKLIDNFPIPKKQRRLIEPRKKRRIAGMKIEAFSLLHSLRCPAVGYRITVKKNRLFYAPDVAWINDMADALKNIHFYIGDGACITQVMVRKDRKTKEIFGHANIRQQLTWCKKHLVPKMIITHCGSAIVKNEKKAEKIIYELAKERGVEVNIAIDHQKIRLP